MKSNSTIPIARVLPIDSEITEFVWLSGCLSVCLSVWLAVGDVGGIVSGKKRGGRIMNRIDRRSRGDLERRSIAMERGIRLLIEYRVGERKVISNISKISSRVSRNGVTRLLLSSSFFFRVPKSPQNRYRPVFGV